MFRSAMLLILRGRWVNDEHCFDLVTGDPHPLRRHYSSCRPACLVNRPDLFKPEVMTTGCGRLRDPRSRAELAGDRTRILQLHHEPAPLALESLEDVIPRLTGVPAAKRGLPPRELARSFGAN